MRLPVISLHQPWASALFLPDVKRHETRGWKPPGRLVGGPLGIQAAKKRPEVDETLDALCIGFFGSRWRDNLPYGSLVGVTQLTGFKEMDAAHAWGGAPTFLDYMFGDWSPGRYAWILEDRQNVAPEPMKGQQGIWSVDR